MAKTDPVIVQAKQDKPEFGYVKGQVFQVVGGPLPPDLHGVLEPYPANLPVPGNVLPLDVPAFLRDVERQRQRAAAPVPKPVFLTADDLLRRFRWDGTRFDQAAGYGFPKSCRQRVSGDGKLEYLWDEAAVNVWAATFQAFVKATRF